MVHDHWADLAALRLLSRENKDSYVVAAGITPSGVVHIGNFREIITVDLVARALHKLGKKVRFIYSWDDYDVFRKVPRDLPGQEVLHKSLRRPIVDVVDVYGCHASYAEHYEKEFEKSLSLVGIFPEFLYQAQVYRNCVYADGMRLALQKREIIVSILNQWRAEPLDSSWWPVTGFCSSCGKDTLTFSVYDGDYGLSYTCTCGFVKRVDLRRDGELSLLWRVDWPMRWAYEHVDFEPGGKDHSTRGGSYTTGSEIVRDVYDFVAPHYVMYDFIGIKGRGGKISSSKGDVITLSDVLSVYEPEMVRWFFAGTRPNTEFSISFDADVIGLYEDFDKLERIYFGEEKVSEQKLAQYKRIYELSCVGAVPERLPFQPSFRHLTSLLQMYNLDVDRTIASYEEQLVCDFDRQRLRQRALCAKYWLENYAPEEFVFRVNESASHIILTDVQKAVLLDLISLLSSRTWDDKSLHEEFYVLLERYSLKNTEFFSLLYQVLIAKEKGPKLAGFILTLGVEKVVVLLKSAVGV